MRHLETLKKRAIFRGEKMTSYAKTIDRTPSGQGSKISYEVGTAGVTAGDAVKLDSDGHVVDCDATTNDSIGVALDTITDGNHVTVLGNGCIVESSSYSFTAGGRLGITVTTGILKDWASSGSYMGHALSATKALIQIEL